MSTCSDKDEGGGRESAASEWDDLPPKRITSYGMGMYSLAADTQEVVNGFGFIRKNEKGRMKEVLNDKEELVAAIYYEMRNHEYLIDSYEGNYNVLKCFCPELEYDEDQEGTADPSGYFEQMGWEYGKTQTLAWSIARRCYMSDAVKYEWG